jgi:outer membrane protein TolC
LAVLRHELAVLAGKPPTAPAFEPEGRLPAPPPLPRTGPPAELLEKRPDVRAARNLVVAADHQLAAARAQRLPSISLTGRLVFSNALSSNLFNDWIGSIIAGLTQPIFDGGRINAEIKQARGVAAERLADYGKVVLAAYTEVEDALANERGQTAHLEALEGRVVIAQATLRQARERYANGLTEYLPVLTSLQTLQGLEVTRLAARRDLLSYRIRLYKALGGAWSRDVIARSEPIGGS